MKHLKEEIFYFYGKKVKYSEVEIYPCATCAFHVECLNRLFAFYKNKIRYLRRCGTIFNYKEINETF